MPNARWLSGSKQSPSAKKAKRVDEKAAGASPTSATARPAAGGKTSADTRKLRKEVNKLERKSAEADERIKLIESQLADPGVYQDQARMNELVGEYEEVKRRADRYLSEWEAASARLEAAG